MNKIFTVFLCLKIFCVYVSRNPGKNNFLNLDNSYVSIRRLIIVNEWKIIDQRSLIGVLVVWFIGLRILLVDLKFSFYFSFSSELIGGFCFKFHFFFLSLKNFVCLLEILIVS